MDIKAYIESGVLEAYILGALPAEEQLRVQADIAAHPELAAEARAIESAMLQYAAAHAMAPPAGMQDKIWSAIGGDAAAQNAGAPDVSVPARAKVIPLQPDYRRPVQWRYAAAIVLLVASLAMNFVLWNQGRQSRVENTSLNNQMDSLRASQNRLAQLVNGYRKSIAMMADTGMQTIVMHTMLPGHPMAATLYWSKAKGEAYVAMNALPAPPQGMQYQLWVIQAGKPVSMGVLPNSMANTPDMQKVHMPVTTGEAFAVSLEKEGGNATPTTVYVLGKA